MSTESTYGVRTATADADSEINRLRAGTLMFWHKERRLLAAYGLRDGDSVLELGCGPGFVTERLLEELPNASVTALDLDPQMIQQAQARLAGSHGSRCTLLVSDARSVPLPDQSFDVVYIRMLLQLVPEPLGVVREALRLLKPGGRLILADADDGAWGAIEPEIPEIETCFARIRQILAQRGGDRRIGRRLPLLLEQAGLKGVEFDALAAHSMEVGSRPFLSQFQLLLRASGQLLDSDDARRRLKENYDRAAADPNMLAIGILFMASGRKPQSASE